MTSSRWRRSGIRMETRVTDQACFILRRREWRNSSLILDLFSRDHGCIRAVARGARRGGGRVPYEPFVLLSVNWSGRQELKTLQSVEGQVLSIDEANYLPLLYVNELINTLLPPAEPNEAVFAAYLRLLQHAVILLEEASLRRFELELLRSLGQLPDLDIDANSGQSLRPDAFYQFIADRGFIACASADANSVNGEIILDWLREDYASDAVRRLAKSVLRHAIDFNLHGRTLKSRDMYLRIKGHS